MGDKEQAKAMEAYRQGFINHYISCGVEPQDAIKIAAVALPAIKFANARVSNTQTSPRISKLK